MLWKVFESISVKNTHLKFVLIIIGVSIIQPRAMAMEPRFTGLDNERQKLMVTMDEVASGFEQITDLVFVPGDSHRFLVLEKTGGLKLFEMQSRQTKNVHKFEVATRSEMGLLGLAFHPEFPETKLVYVNYSPVRDNGTFATRVSEWQWQENSGSVSLANERVLLEVDQPYPNHNAGQLKFGPDKHLYIGMGDGGSANDPHKHGQNTQSLLGKMLRISPSPDQNRPYTVPADNPFVGNSAFAPEIWAYGLRNPWRYTFLSDGRLVVADVGQNRLEEVNIVEKGDNSGWAIMEGTECFAGQRVCDQASNLISPVLEYGRTDGGSITGGYEYKGPAIAELRGHYVFGDFLSGRIWGVELPKNRSHKVDQKEFLALGQWPMQVATFGQMPSGEILVADFSSGSVYQIKPQSR